MRRLTYAVLAASLLAAAGASLADVEYTPSYPLLLVSDPPDEPQRVGRGLAQDPTGNVVAVWQVDGTRNGGSHSEVFARRIGADGVPLTAPWRVSDENSALAMYPAIGSDAAGNFVVAWEEINGSDTAILARRYDISGNPLGDAVRINPVDAPAGGGPWLAVNGAGDYLVVWGRNDAPQYTVVGRLFNALGQAQGDEIPLPQFSGEGARVAGLALTPDRHIIAGNLEYDGDGLGNFQLQCLDAQGVPLGNPVVTGPHTATRIPDSNGGDLALTADGNILMAWPETRIDTAQDTLVLKSYAPDCATENWSRQVLAVDHTQQVVYDAHLAVDASDSGVAVSWKLDKGDYHNEVAVRRYDNAGNPLGASVTIDGDYSLIDTPWIALRPGGFTAVWSRYAYDTPELAAQYDNVYARGYAESTVTPLQPPAASAFPAAVDFGRQAINTVSAAQTISVTNTGGQPLHIGTPSIAGDNRNDFTVLANGCTAPVAPNAVCNIKVAFKPVLAGARDTTLQIPSDGSTQIVALAGTGSGACLHLAIGPFGGLVCVNLGLVR